MPPLTGDYRIGPLYDISKSKDRGSSSFKSGNVGMDCLLVLGIVFGVDTEDGCSAGFAVDKGDSGGFGAGIDSDPACLSPSDRRDNESLEAESS